MQTLVSTRWVGDIQQVVPALREPPAQAQLGALNNLKYNMAAAQLTCLQLLQ